MPRPRTVDGVPGHGAVRCRFTAGRQRCMAHHFLQRATLVCVGRAACSGRLTGTGLIGSSASCPIDCRLVLRPATRRMGWDIQAYSRMAAFHQSISEYVGGRVISRPAVPAAVASGLWTEYQRTRSLTLNSFIFLPNRVPAVRCVTD